MQELIIREGLVLCSVYTLRVDGKRVSFKVINLKYKGWP